MAKALNAVGRLPHVTKEMLPIDMLVRCRVKNPDTGEKLEFQGLVELPKALGKLKDQIRQDAIKGIRTEAQNRLRSRKKRELGFEEEGGGSSEKTLETEYDPNEVENI